MMDKFHKAKDFNCDTALSKSYRVALQIVILDIRYLHGIENVHCSLMGYYTLLACNGPNNIGNHVPDNTVS